MALEGHNLVEWRFHRLLRTAKAAAGARTQAVSFFRFSHTCPHLDYPAFALTIATHTSSTSTLTYLAAAPTPTFIGPAHFR